MNAQDDDAASVPQNNEYPQSPEIIEIENEISSGSDSTASTNTVTDIETDITSSVEKRKIDESVNIYECSCGKRRRIIDNEDKDESQQCPICFENWSNVGDHRLCSLRCGHLFGLSCLTRWLTEQKVCPTCKTSVRKTDIRHIYAKKIVVVDTSKIVALTSEINIGKEKIKELQNKFNGVRSREQYLMKKVEYLENEIKKYKNRAEKCTSLVQDCGDCECKIYKETTIEINKAGTCRVMDFCKNSKYLAVSTKASNVLFSGFGIRLVSVAHLRSTVYIPLHTDTIRDLSFHPERELLLSVSIDGNAKLVETTNKQTIDRIDLGEPLWSSCWDSSNGNCFYIGKQSGMATKYDMRNLNEPVQNYSFEGDRSPVVALASAGWNPGSALPHGGLFVCKLNCCTVFTDSSNDVGYDSHPLDARGPCTSMRYDNSNGHLLVTTRPRGSCTNILHTLYTLEAGTSGISYQPMHTFEGAPIQKYLSRSHFINIPEDMLVAANHDTDKAINIWSCSKGKKIFSFPTNSPVMDICPIHVNSTRFLAALNDKKVDFFKIDT